jgi:hypothetical protein
MMSPPSTRSCTVSANDAGATTLSTAAWNIALNRWAKSEPSMGGTSVMTPPP